MANAVDAVRSSGGPWANATGLIQIAPGLSAPGVAITFSANEQIFGENEPADFIYTVVSGATRTMRLLDDGRRHIGAFHLPGDVFGLERGNAHRFTAEAIVASKIALVRRATLERAAECDCLIAHRLRSLIAHELEDLQDHMLLLGHGNASQRVEQFLVRLARRTASATVDLPMSRCDIADHLGLTLETVSRTLNQLVRDRAIELPSVRRVVVRLPREDG